MAGITAYGAYVPLWRLSRDDIGKAWVAASMGGERSVAGHDEDSITMAVEAGIDCLKGLERQNIDGLLFASTTAPYKEKQCAALVAAALDLREDIITSDFANSLRAGSLAFRSAIDAVNGGSANNCLITAADCRIGYPNTTDEQAFGDGAAALLIGNSDIVCEIEAVYSISNEIVDVWRTDKERFVHSWENRFIIERGYNECMNKAISGLMKQKGFGPKDFTKAVFYGPDNRSQQGLATTLGFDTRSQLQQSSLPAIGNTGTPHALMALVSALEEAEPNDRILLASYGDGADAFILRVTDAIRKIKVGRGVKGYIKSKRMLPSYNKYLLYRELLEQPFELFNVDSAATTLWRDRRWVLRGHAAKCRKCGTTTFPIERICYQCQSKDDFDEIRITDKRAKVFTFSRDRLAGGSAESTVVQTVAESEEGATRMYGMMTDCDPEQVEIGMPIEMTFRRIREDRGFYSYFWKFRPIRKGE